LLIQLYDVVVARIRVFIFKIEEQSAGASDMRTGMPGRTMEFDEVTGRNPKGSNLLGPGPRLV
jgi:hypothetical protein